MHKNIVLKWVTLTSLKINKKRQIMVLEVIFASKYSLTVRGAKTKIAVSTKSTMKKHPQTTKVRPDHKGR